jgi:hypothetical protein
MTDLAVQAKPAVEKLLLGDETQLYEQLGIRAKAIAEDPGKGSSFEPDVTYDETKMGLKEDVLNFGKKLFKRWNEQAYKIMCGTDPEDQKDREELKKAFNVSEVSVAATLSALLVTNFGLAAAVAAVIAAIVIKRFFRPSYEEFCKFWKSKIGDDS